MNNLNTLEKYFLDSPIITNKEAEQLGIKRHTLAAFAKKGTIERVKNGVYKKKDAIDDEFASISLNSSNLVFSFQTALYLLGFSDRTPNVFHISVPQGYNAEHITRKFSNIKVHYVKKEFFNIGMSSVKTPLGSYVKCYDIERSICDIVLWRKSIDKQAFVDAIRSYFTSKNKNLRKLITYSKVLNVEDEVRMYIEVL